MTSTYAWTSKFFFKMSSSYFPFHYSSHGLDFSQFLNFDLIQQSLVYLSDLWSDPWMVILSQTHTEYSLWLTSQHTSGNVVFYCTLYICMLMCIRRREKEMYWISSELSPLTGLYRPYSHRWHLSQLCACVCMHVACFCVRLWLFVSPCLFMCGNMVVWGCPFVRGIHHCVSLNHPADCSIDGRMHHTPPTSQKLMMLSPQNPFCSLTIKNHHK